MELTTNKYGTRILTPSDGKQIALASDTSIIYEYQVYLGNGDSPDRYIEVDAPEPEPQEVVNE